MFAVVACRECLKKRVVDLNDKSSTCPYCGTSGPHKNLRIYFQSDDQSLVRAALRQLTGFVPPVEKKQTSDADPYSTLEYRYEHCHSVDEKMRVLAEGLTAVYGEFTFEDLGKIEPKHAEKYLKAMLVEGYVHETKYGRYTA